MIYIINDEVKFNSSSNKLTSLTTSDEVMLTYPAGKCLSLLLDNAHQVVSHHRFFEKVWSGAESEVATNTLYQNISIIRRSFRELSTSPDASDIIRTVPRKGFKINEEATVKVVETPKDTPEHDAIHEDVVNQEESLPPLKERLLKKSNIMWLWISIACVSIYIISYMIYNFHNNMSHTVKSEDVFSEYKHLVTKQGCTFYYDNKSFPSANALAPVINEMNRLDIKCERNPYIYISTTNTMRGFYALACNSKLDQESSGSCSSLFIKMELNHE
ncbi:transcriptional regulator [Pseudocitrobacter sp. RIT415]|uniref:winged helix-turn-helix domain-containing protein n=1 Tax=Pseudocitrobacter sp. RIT415 TaxID=2202163 RepID=UPI000D35602E|nr:winged helix-turn-helix domain-containing protein [Pseudocitrobacter sp. RIT 415]RAU50184.1 transcriptional regulator [Pseudocitrobacter sp. RIT 415]